MFILERGLDVANSKKAIKTNGRPTKVTVDKSGSNKAALDYCNENVKEEEKSDKSKYLNNIVEHNPLRNERNPRLGLRVFNLQRQRLKE